MPLSKVDHGVMQEVATLSMTVQLATFRLDEHADADLVSLAFRRIGDQEVALPATPHTPHSYVLDMPGARVHVDVTVEG